MAEITYRQEFYDMLLLIEREDKRKEILKRVSNLSISPEYGSTRISLSIARRYGADVRRLVVSSFDLIYSYDSEMDMVTVLGLVHQHSIQ